MNNAWVLVVVVAILPAILSVVMGNWRRVQLRRLEVEAQALGRNEAFLAERIRSLEERVAVLERLATDPGRRLAREIDLLKDERP